VQWLRGLTAILHPILTRKRIYIIVYTNALYVGRAEEPWQSTEAWHQLRDGYPGLSRSLHITRQDRIVEGEERWQSIGRVGGVLLVLVAYSVVDDKDEALCIISARRVTRQERIEYEEANEI
jgi:uncharacterized DUF497 family protein